MYRQVKIPLERLLRHLPALGVHRAAGRDRAGPAAGVHPGPVDRARHALGHRVDELQRPAGVRVIGQRALALHLAPARSGRPCRPGRARRRRARSRRAARTRRAGRRAGRRRAAGAGRGRRRAARTPPVFRSTMTPRSWSSRSSRSTRPVISTWPTWTLSACSVASSSRGLAVCQSRNLRTIFSASSRCRVPYQTLPKSRWCQMSSILVATCVLGGALGDELGGRVDDGAEVAQHVRVPGPDRRLKQPAQAAAGERLHVGRRQPDPLAVADDRRRVGQLGQRVPSAPGRRRARRRPPAGPSWTAAARRSASGRAGSAAVRRRSATSAGSASQRVAALARSISISSPRARRGSGTGAGPARRRRRRSP